MWPSFKLFKEIFNAVFKEQHRRQQKKKKNGHLGITRTIAANKSASSRHKEIIVITNKKYDL